MTRRDGSTALVALILALACVLRAYGLETAARAAETDDPTHIDGLRDADSLRRFVLFGELSDPSGKRAGAYRQEPSFASSAVLPLSEPAAPSYRTRINGLRDADSLRRFVLLGELSDPSGKRAGAYRQEPSFASSVAALFSQPTARNEPTETERPPNVDFLSLRILDGFSNGDEGFPSSPSADDDRPQIPELNLIGDWEPPSSNDFVFLTPGQSPDPRWLALRFGWWGIKTDGSRTKVGEYQDFDSSPFFDADVLHSDGVRTIDLFVTGLDLETYQTGLDYFGPELQADLDLQEYLHRLDHDPLTNMGDLQSGEEIVREDLNVGEDYAIRVEDLKTSFRGKLTENIKLRLNFHLLRKHGERQANAVRHCAGGIPQVPGGLPQNTCHVLSQRQRIDWQTVSIEPVVEGDFGPVRAEYSRPMRVFNRNDQVVLRPFGVHFPTDLPYAFVPENVTQIDRLKLAVDLLSSTSFYARLQTGDTQNRFRQTHRRFYGFDLRLTNRSWDGVTLTGYATLNEQRNQSLPFLLPVEEDALAVKTSLIPPYGIRHPIDYFRRKVGAEASWRPFQRGAAFRGFTLTTGAEQGLIDRRFADYVVQVPEEPPGPVIDQERTAFTTFHVGASHRWSPSLDTYVRYRLRVTKDPLFAVNRYYGFSNTNLPEEENLIQFGGTWMPASNFLATATVGLQDRHHHSEVADFEEDNYPMTFTLWYAPAPKWSLSAGYGFYSTWIDQDITFPSDTPGVSVGDTRPWSYGGRGDVVSLGGSYGWTQRLTLSGGLQLVRTRDAIDPLAPWPDLGQNFDVIVNRTRVTGGIDWCLREDVSSYFRYLFEDYEDKSTPFNSGSAHMFLAGLTVAY
ncbi:MAG: hypothetical protein ACYTG0_06785 [Planctomycetota bacterium]|jgi:hypothetical protein